MSRSIWTGYTIVLIKKPTRNTPAWYSLRYGNTRTGRGRETGRDIYLGRLARTVPPGHRVYMTWRMYRDGKAGCRLLREPNMEMI